MKAFPLVLAALYAALSTSDFLIGGETTLDFEEDDDEEENPPDDGFDEEGFDDDPHPLDDGFELDELLERNDDEDDLDEENPPDRPPLWANTSLDAKRIAKARRKILITVIAPKEFLFRYVPKSIYFLVMVMFFDNLTFV